jgi:hypothetical protein
MSAAVRDDRSIARSRSDEAPDKDGFSRLTENLLREKELHVKTRMQTQAVMIIRYKTLTVTITKFRKNRKVIRLCKIHVAIR